MQVGVIIRALARFFAAVIATTGALLIVDAALTIAWQEPISALIAQNQQGALAQQLSDAKADPPPPTCNTQLPPQPAEATQYAGGLHTGDPVGHIELPTLGRSYVFVQGTDEGSLQKGPGHYPQTPLPGQPGTTAIAGHRTTFLAPFRTIDQLRSGDTIVIRMPYGCFTYKVERSVVVNPDALWVTNPVGYDRLVLSACNPLYSASQRIIVFARRV